MPSSTFFLDQSESQKRQFIDAETVFLATAQAKKVAAEVRGSMLWRDLRGKATLIRTSANGAQKSLGPRSEDTEAMYASFMARKKSAEERLKALKTQLATQQRLNRALRVGRVLNALESIGVQDHFMVVGTHALYAYETAAGVRITQEAMATRDVDMLFDARKHISFFTTMKKLDSSLIGVLRKVDPSFEVVQDQLYTARNQDGFEVDIIRRAAKDADPHPLRMSEDEGDFWAVQVSMGERLQSARRMDQVVVGTSGEMALMRTIHPLDFARIKQDLSTQLGRDPNKSGKDALPSRIVNELVNAYLPHFLLPGSNASVS
nr:GSU2403 family nucleotidyltransferase fold protein [uncultured Rhodoferax sp.]